MATLDGTKNNSSNKAVEPGMRRKQASVLISSTFAFTICFAVWMMFAVLGIPIKTSLGLTETQFGLLAAMPAVSYTHLTLPTNREV